MGEQDTAFVATHGGLADKLDALDKAREGKP